MKFYILDTNLFFNMEPGLNIGSKTQIVIEKASIGMKRLRAKKEAEFIMPPSVVGEFLGFFDDQKQLFLQDFLTQISVKSPDSTHIQITGSIFYALIEDIRKRSYRGLTIAEEEMKLLASQLKNENKTQTKVEFEKQMGPHIQKLRERFRQATRAGFIDSTADLDLIMLAKELKGYLVSTDEGVRKWGRTFGVREVDPQIFGKLLTKE